MAEGILSKIIDSLSTYIEKVSDKKVPLFSFKQISHITFRSGGDSSLKPIEKLYESLRSAGISSEEDIKKIIIKIIGHDGGSKSAAAFEKLYVSLLEKLGGDSPDKISEACRLTAKIIGHNGGSKNADAFENLYANLLEKLGGATADNMSEACRLAAQIIGQNGGSIIAQKAINLLNESGDESLFSLCRDASRISADEGFDKPLKIFSFICKLSRRLTCILDIFIDSDKWKTFSTDSLKTKEAILLAALNNIVNITTYISENPDRIPNVHALITPGTPQTQEAIELLLAMAIENRFDAPLQNADIDLESESTTSIDDHEGRSYPVSRKCDDDGSSRAKRLHKEGANDEL